jgi:hypothetical protein
VYPEIEHDFTDFIKNAGGCVMGRKSRDRSYKKSSLSKRNGLSKKSMRFQVKPLDLTVANINYALNAAPLFDAAFSSQAEISGSSIYSFFVVTAALLGEAAKSFVTTEEEGDETLREASSRSSRQALGHAWDRVIKEWGEEFPGISSDELEELKIDSYAYVFQYDEKKETAHIDKSSIAADSIQAQINSLLRTRLNKGGQDQIHLRTRAWRWRGVFSEPSEALRQ